MGSDSDREVMEKAGGVFDRFDVPFETEVMSAHRNPGRVTAYATGASERGLKVIIAGAGMAAHLPGVVAAHSILPVIGVPLYQKALGGQDALYSCVQMPPGVPVATVAIDGAKNAGVLACQILAVTDDVLAAKLAELKNQMTEGFKL
ncbi:MAG: 5-(carboxyamino)imidazole ribonucleotide mutase [Actinobacteria bacterium]|nr:5-(carboxyamino)imidazole ribonucleotide mutase [Actinomycetota bacterium]MDQ3216809.1 5-(carboxyamino)imidazole ribonucleotide mutase [Actinomycetota bacterium]